MPTYDFKCRNCESTVTIAIGIRENLINPVCATCQAAMIRDYAIAAVEFKGSGWASKEK